MNEREQFEAVFSQPPFEFRLTRYKEDAPWPGHYVVYQEQLTWEGWQARAALAAAPAQPTGDLMPSWIKYDSHNDVLTIHGKRYSAMMFGETGFLSPPGTLLRVEAGYKECVTLSKVQLEQIAPQPNTAYAALPDTYYLAGGEVKTWDENHMLAFADATHALRAFHVQAPAVAAVEIHEAKCPALIGDACSCERSDPAVDKAWAQFCAGIGDGPDAPYPGMIVAFERYYGQSFADKDWRDEAAVWAAAWKARDAQPTPTAQGAPDSVLEDAARYRWLRDCNLAKFPEINSAFYLGNKNLDTAIDAARKQRGQS